MSPYVPFIVVSDSATVKSKSLFVSPAFPVTDFVTFSPPNVSLVFVNAATATFFSSIVPVLPV